MIAFATPVMLTASASRGWRRDVGALCDNRNSNSNSNWEGRARMAAAAGSSSDEGTGTATGQLAGLRPGEMAVRFTNTPSGSDVVAAAKPGDILLSVGDSVGITIPRGCVSGLCGSCTCDIVDANSINGLQTVRACQTVAADMDGCGTMTVDLARMKDSSGRKGFNPMARFDNMDTQYVAGAPPKKLDKRGRMLTAEIPCATCATSGDVECYGCDGAGVEVGLDNSSSALCMLCAGTGALRCADCQGTGVVKTS